MADDSGNRDAGGVAALGSRDGGSAAPERPGSRDGDVLADYRRSKLALAELIQSLMSVAVERRDQDGEVLARDLLARLTEDRFQLAVVGQFSRGKSTLMNAVLGHPYLPTGALPMTSLVTTVRYGSRPRAFVQRAGSPFRIEVSLDELPRFVAQTSDEREELRVVAAHVEVPSEILRLGFSFVDTPGIGSAIAANTATTESFLPEADALIFVTGFDAPLSAAELDFLAKVRAHVERLFVVVNKLDLVPEAEAEGVVRFVCDRLVPDGGKAGPRVFALSALEALEGRMSADRGRLTASGLPELELALVRFLTTEKPRALLLQTVARTERLLAREKADLELARRVQSEDDSERHARWARFDDRAADLIVEVREVSAALVRDVEAQFPMALVERSRLWPQELGRRIADELDGRWPQPSGPEQARAQAVELAQAQAREWLGERLAESRAALLRIAGGHVERLERLEQAGRRIAAEVFDAEPAGAAPEPSRSSGVDLPELEPPPVALDIRLDLPRWSLLRSAARRSDDEQSRILAGLERGVLAYCEEVRRALGQAAMEAAQALGERMEARTRSATERVRERLGRPEVDRHLAVAEEVEQRLVGFRQAVAEWDPGPGVERLPDVDRARASQTAHVLMPCVLCERIAAVPFEHLARAQHELATSGESRRTHAARGGFCALHTWQYAHVASERGIALAYAELAETASALLRAAHGSAAQESDLREALVAFTPGRERCPVCLALAQAERDAVVALVADLGQRAHAATPPALCLPHLAAVLATGPGVERARWLVGSLADGLARAAEDMRVYVLKRDSLRRHLVDHEEQAAHMGVIARIAAHRALAWPWRDADQ